MYQNDRVKQYYMTSQEDCKILVHTHAAYSSWLVLLSLKGYFGFLVALLKLNSDLQLILLIWTKAVTISDFH